MHIYNNKQVFHSSEAPLADSAEPCIIEEVSTKGIKRSVDLSDPPQAHKKTRISDSEEAIRNALKAIIDNPLLPLSVKNAAEPHWAFLVKEKPFSELADEIRLKIFEYLPDERQSLKLVSRQFNQMSKDTELHKIWFQIRLNDLEAAFHEKRFSERWEAHLQIVKHRLKTKEIEENPKTIYQELIEFQKERFPKEPFQCDANPYTAEGFLEREMIIKEWNYFLMAKDLYSNPMIPSSLEDISSSNVLFFLTKQIKLLPVPEITNLKCREKGFTEIPEEIGTFKDLNELDFSNNAISWISKDCFKNLTELIILYLDGNQLVSLDKEVFKALTMLTVLWLHKNQLIALPEEIFAPLINLLKLYINHNQLTTLPKKIFAPLSNLQILDLSDNRLVKLDSKIFEPFTNLRKLYLDRNQLRSLHGQIFETLRNLRDLSLGNNQLTAFHEMIFATLVNLEGLWINENQLAELDNKIFTNLTSLEMLNLEKNPLPPIDQEDFAGFDNLEIIL